MRLFTDSIALEDPVGELVHRVVAVSLVDDSCVMRFRRFFISLCFRKHHILDLIGDAHPAFMPYDFLGFGSIKETPCIKRIVIKEWIGLLELHLHRSILICIHALGDWEIHMISGCRGLGTLWPVVVAACSDAIAHIREKLVQLLGSDVKCGIIGVVVVDVHRDYIGFDEAFLAPVAVPVCGAHMVKCHSGLQLLR